MSTETTNKKIKIDNGTTFGRTYTDKAVDELLKNVGGGGDIWLNISPYVNSETMTISQEGYDLVWNSFSNYTSSPVNKYAGIDVDGSQKFFFDKSILSDIGGKQGLGFIHKINIDGAEGCSFLNIYEDKSVEFDSKRFDNNLTLPSTSPSSQLIPSITTNNEQQNLTVGNGLEIKNGVLQEKVLNVSVSMTAEQLSQSINSGDVSINYTETDKSTVFDFIKAQKGIMRLTVNTPIGNLYMTLRPSLWKDDTNHSYNFEGTLYLETDLSSIGGTGFNQIIVRAICWDTNNSVNFRPTIIPIRK